MLYGFPGAGKTHFARRFSEALGAAHVHGDRLRHELLEEPRYDKSENEAITNLMLYMTEAFLGAGLSVVYDTNLDRHSQRRELREIARKFKTQPVMVWVQIDIESAFSRVASRDRRKLDDRFAQALDRTTFESAIGRMQNPQPTEDYIVISGKHTYDTQAHMTLKRLFNMGLVNMIRKDGTVVKPELVNKIPNPTAGRVDPSRRNIVIR